MIAPTLPSGGPPFTAPTSTSPPLRAAVEAVAVGVAAAAALQTRPLPAVLDSTGVRLVQMGWPFFSRRYTYMRKHVQPSATATDAPSTPSAQGGNSSCTVAGPAGLGLVGGGGGGGGTGGGGEHAEDVSNVALTRPGLLAFVGASIEPGAGHSSNRAAHSAALHSAAEPVWNVWCVYTCREPGQPGHSAALQQSHLHRSASAHPVGGGADGG